MNAAETPDRTARLVVSGALTIVAGVGISALGALVLVLPVLLPGLADETLVDPRDRAAGFVLYVMIGATLIWAGTGSIRRRRWARPIMLLVSVTWLAAGLVALPIAVWTLETLLASPGSAGTAAGAAAGIVRWALIAGFLVAGVLVPAFLLWVYRDPAVQRTCDLHHLAPSWCDGCPSELLGLGAALVAAGLTAVPLALRAALPVFGHLLVGLPGTIATLGLAGVCLGLGHATLRRHPAGWWGTLAFLVVTGVSTVWTFLVGDPAALQAGLGLGQGSLAAGPFPDLALRWAGVAGGVGLTLAGVLYLGKVRPLFVNGGDGNRA